MLKFLLRASCSFLLLGCLLTSSTAMAGSLFVIDKAGILSSADRAALTDSASTLPFSVKLLTSKDYTDRNIFIRITESNLPDDQSVIIGVNVNPAARVLWLEAGDASGLTKEHARELAEKSEKAFDQKRWRQSLFLLFSELRRENYTKQSSDAVTLADTTFHPRTAPTSPRYSAVIALFVLTILFIVFFSWRRARNQKAANRANMRSRNVNGPY